MPKSVTLSDFIARAIDTHGPGRFDYSDSVYLGMRKPIEIFCISHNKKFSLSCAAAHLDQRRGCEKCSSESYLEKRRQRAEAHFLRKAKAIHGNRFDYSASEFRGALEPIDIVCIQHQLTFTVPKAMVHLRRERGCAKCKQQCKENDAKRRGSNWSERVEEKHPGHFDLSKIVYVNEDTPVAFSCKTNPEEPAFKVEPYRVLQAVFGGCPYCGPVQTTDELVRRCKKIHSPHLDFSKAVFVRQHDHVSVHCSLHDYSFPATAHNLLLGHGCVKCGHDRVAEFQSSTTEQFIATAIDIHGERYSYERMIYRARSEEIEVGCPVHGFVKIVAGQHLVGCGCTLCGDIVGAIAVGKERLSDHLEIAEMEATLYYVRFVNARGEEFFKVGYTSMSISKRFSGFLAQNNLIGRETVAAWRAPLAAVVSVEQEILREHKAMLVQEKVLPSGNTETFRADVLGLTRIDSTHEHERIAKRLANAILLWRMSPAARNCPAPDSTDT